MLSILDTEYSILDTERMENLIGVAFLVVVLAISITCHEFMHAYVSYRLGDDTARLSGRLSLNPLAHIDPFGTVLLPIILFLAHLPVFGAAKPVPFDPTRLRNGDMGAAMVALAGPFTNLVLAIFISLWLRLIPVGGLAEQFMELFVMVNVGFFIFNMIPFPPLDGSRLFYALAPDPLRALMQRVESFGLLGVFVFIFFLFPFISPIVGRAMSSLMSFLIPGYSLTL